MIQLSSWWNDWGSVLHFFDHLSGYSIPTCTAANRAAAARGGESNSAKEESSKPETFLYWESKSDR